MPITPLHLGLMALVLHRVRTRGAWLALASFTLVNIWIDLDAILAVLRMQPLPGHDTATHTLFGAMVAALVIALPGALPWIRSIGWVAGSFYGAISHILLDAMVHPDMVPFKLMLEGNPLYLGIMGPLSLALLPLLIWLIAQCVSGSLEWRRRRRAATGFLTGPHTSSRHSPGPPG